MLAEEVSAAKSDPQDKTLKPELSWEKKWEDRGKFVSVTGMAMLMLMVAGLFISLPLVTIFGLHLSAFKFIGPVLLSIAIPLLFIGVGMMAYPRLIKELRSTRSPQSPTLQPAETTTKLSPARAPELRPSVAESTTELLRASEAGAGQVARADTTSELKR